MKVQGVEEFVNVHGVLLASAGLPPSLHEHLFHKLSGDVFDGGKLFQIEPCKGGRQRRLVLCEGALRKDPQDVFLVDHAWLFRSRKLSGAGLAYGYVRLGLVVA